MDAERAGSVTDSADAIDREIRAALAVAPSPEFVALVRTRIASDADCPRPWLSWHAVSAVAGVVVAAGLIVLAVALSQPNTVSPDRSIAKADIHLEAALRSAPGSDAGAVVPLKPDAMRVSPSLTGPRPVARLRWQTPAPAGEPDVLVDPREAAALRALIARARAGEIDLAPVLRASTPSALDLAAITNIAIAPLTIDPLEGARQ